MCLVFNFVEKSYFFHHNEIQYDYDHENAHFQVMCWCIDLQSLGLKSDRKGAEDFGYSIFKFLWEHIHSILVYSIQAWITVEVEHNRIKKQNRQNERKICSEHNKLLFFFI